MECRTGRILKEDGTYVNIADILGGADTGEKRDISKYSPMSGRMIKEDGTVVNIAENIGGGGSGGTTNYNQLTNRPKINGTTLEGNLTAEDLGLQPENLVVTLTQNGESITADKNYADINQAYTDGKDIYAVIEGNIVPLYGKAGTTYIFQSVLGVQVTDFELNSEDTWSVETINIIANSTRPGGIIADEKTDDDTVEVHVDSKTGKAYVNASQDTTTAPPIINTASGNPITLTDSSDNLFQGFKMDGKTEQVTTTGAQLFDASKLKSNTIGNVTITNNGDGSFTVGGNGVISDNVNYAYDLTKTETLNLIKAGELCLKVDQSLIPHFDILIHYNGNFSELLGISTSIKKFEITDEILQADDLYLRMRFYGNSEETIKPGTVKPMLYQSGDGTWEPYTGGSPSPSPDYPQPIINGGTCDEEAEKWEYEVGVGGTQLFDASKIPTKTQGGATVTNNGDGSFTISGSGTLTNNFGTNFICTHEEMVKIFKQGTLNAVIEAATYPRLYINLYNSSGFVKTLIELTDITDQDEILQEYLDNEDYYMNIGFTASSGRNIIPGSIKPMIYQTGSGTWEPYRTPQSVTLTADRPLTKWDKLEKRNGQWGWVYKSNTHTFNGNTDEGWYKEQDYVVSGLLRDEIAKDKEVYCGEFMDARKNSATSPYISVSKSGSVVVKYTQYTNGDISAWNEYVTSNPFVIWYETAEETFTPLTPEESAALDALVSYYPTTVISNQQGLNMTVDYIADTKAYINNKFAELQQSLANTNAQLLGGN